MATATVDHIRKVAESSNDPGMCVCSLCVCSLCVCVRARACACVLKYVACTYFT